MSASVSRNVGVASAGSAPLAFCIRKVAEFPLQITRVADKLIKNLSYGCLSLRPHGRCNGMSHK